MEEKIKEEFIGRYLYLYKNREFFYKLLSENNGKYLQEGCKILEYILLGSKSIDAIYEDSDYFKDLEKQFLTFANSKKMEQKSGIVAFFDKAKCITEYILEKYTSKDTPIILSLPTTIKGKKYQKWVDRPTEKEIEAFENTIYNTELHNLYGIDNINSMYNYDDDILNIIYILKTLYQYIDNQYSPMNEEGNVSELKEHKLKCINKYLTIPKHYYSDRYNIKEAVNHEIASASYPFALNRTIIFRIKDDFGEKRNEFISYVSQNPILSEEEKRELYLRTNEEVKTKIK